MHVSSSVSWNFRSLLFLEDAKKGGAMPYLRTRFSSMQFCVISKLTIRILSHQAAKNRPIQGNNAKRKVGFVKGVWKSKCMTYSRYVGLEPNLNNSQNNINSKGCWNGWSPLRCQIQVSFVNVHEIFPCVFWKDLWQYLCTYPIIRWFFCYSTDLFPRPRILWNEVTRPWWG